MASSKTAFPGRGGFLVLLARQTTCSGDKANRQSPLPGRLAEAGQTRGRCRGAALPAPRLVHPGPVCAPPAHESRSP